jgi:Fe-S cluster assembly protein SufD
MTTTDVKATEEDATGAGDERTKDAVGGAAGVAPVAAQRSLADAPHPGAGTRDDVTENDVTLPAGDEKAASARTRAGRLQSFEVADFSRPTSKEEEWRFTPLRVLAPLFEDAPTDDRPDDPAIDYQVDLPDDVPAAQALAPGQAPRGTALVPEDIIAAVASARTEQALHLRTAPNTEASGPLRVTMTGNGTERRGNAHLVLETGTSSTGTFVLDHTGSARMAENVEAIVGDNSQMTLISLQNWDDDALHVSTHHARLGRDAKLKHIVVSLGGRAVRVNVTGELAEPGSEIEALGLYFSDADQYLEHRLFIDHAAPNCTSDSAYKGALQGKGARSVWVGDVLIRKVAEGTSTYEMNRNLVLTEGARADSVPNLEIETGEIEGAGHAAATGRFDDEQLFYLRARGIPELEARRLVVRGFFAELIQKIDVPEIREALSASIETELARSMN